MSRLKMRIGSILLVVAMLMTLLPVGVFAAGEVEIAPAILHDTSNAIADENLYDAESYKVETTEVAEGENAPYTEVTISISGLKEHQNGEDPARLGHWVGFAVKAPDEATKLEYWMGKDGDEGIEWYNDGTAISQDFLDKGAAGGEDGFAYYAKPTTAYTWLKIQWKSDEENVGSAKLYHVDLSGVEYVMPVTVTSAEGEETTYASLEAAFAEVTGGETVSLTDDVVMRKKITISQNVTLEGNNHTITGVSADAGVYFEITGGTFTVKDVTMTGFGDKAETALGAGVFKIPDTASEAKIVANNVNVNSFNRAAYDVRKGTFEITGGTIDCDNGATERLTKGIVAGYSSNSSVVGTVKDTVINGANSTYEGWSANGIEVSAGGTVTVDNVTINSMKGGISVARNAGSGKANVTVNNSTITAADYALRIFESNSSQDPVKGSSATLTVNGGKYSGDVRISIGSEKKPDGSSFIVITKGGYFTVDPTAYLNDGLVAVESDDAAYLYMVGEKSATAAEVVAGESAVKNELSESEEATEEQKALASSVASAWTSQKPSLNEDSVNAAAASVANQNQITAEAGEAALEEAGVTVGENDTVTIVVQPYMDVKITGVDATEGAQTITLDITPMYRVIATTNPSDIKLDDNGDTNAVEMTAEPQTLTVSKPTTVTIPLPSGFVSGGNGKLYIKHVKDNGATYYYTGNVENNVLSFISQKGFSSFTISATSEAVAEVNGVGYATLKEAIEAVEDEGTVKLLKDNLKAQVNKTIKFKVTSDNTYTCTITDGRGQTITAGDDGFYSIVAFYPSDDGGSSTGTTSYGITVSTAENGTVKSSNSSAAKDATVTITVTPGEGYVLDTLTVTDKDNNTVALTKVSDTQYTFKMPASAVTVKATFKKDEGTQPAVLPFNDVSESEWFYEAVKYVYDKGMMNGVSDTAFAPYSNLTRGMIAQVLYNLEGKPAVSGSAYTDVAADQWYNDAVNWAAQKGIVTGYGDGTFGPMDNITREQMAAILYRYAQYKGYDVSAKGDLTAFTDGNTVSDWAKDAMSWAVGTTLFNGKGDGILDPTTTATRAEVAKILMTYCENVAK